MSYYLGIDFGTSGARAIAIDSNGTIKAQVQSSFVSDTDLALTWKKTLFALIESLPKLVREGIDAIAINGTSSTVLLCDKNGNPVDLPILYNDSRGIAVKERLAAIAPSHHVVQSPTSSLAKLLWWEQQQSLFSQASYFLHQADWLAFLLHNQLGISDYHNALKLGYDVEQLCYPNWLQELPFIELLPKVLPPGEPISEVKLEIAQQLGLSSHCLICTGTTDSIAAFLASGANSPGEAVTSLGSTLVLKLLSEHRIEDSRYGIYSHRLGNLWLAGGASNTGGAVLRHFFDNEELARLSQQIDGSKESPLVYYPLLEKGDRFPINDPNLPPKLTPRPDNPVELLHGLLESIARIEAQGYQLLQQLGATPLTRVYTAGGGAKNPTWQQIRQRQLQVPLIPSFNTEAAYGTALLAKQHC